MARIHRPLSPALVGVLISLSCSAGALRSESPELELRELSIGRHRPAQDSQAPALDVFPAGVVDTNEGAVAGFIVGAQGSPSLQLWRKGDTEECTRAGDPVTGFILPPAMLNVGDTLLLVGNRVSGRASAGQFGALEAVRWPSGTTPETVIVAQPRARTENVVRVAAAAEGEVAHVLYSATEQRMRVTELRYRRSEDGGRNWSESVLVGKDPIRVELPLEFLQWEQDEFGVVAGDGGGAPTMYRTADGGSTWSSASIELTDALEGVRERSYFGTVQGDGWDGILYLAELDGGRGRWCLLRSTDGSRTWSAGIPMTAPFVIEDPVALTAIAAAGDTVALAWPVVGDDHSWIGGQFEVHFAYSDDRGASWTTLERASDTRVLVARLSAGSAPEQLRLTAATWNPETQEAELLVGEIR